MKPTQPMRPPEEMTREELEHTITHLREHIYEVFSEQQARIDGLLKHLKRAAPMFTEIGNGVPF